ncbi:MAG: nucleoside deaminase [Flavobacteriales bacterium]|nr:nucleoside deaminase [Flavobacteriales bacterium]
MDHHDLLHSALHEAFEGMRSDMGGPFGAVIVNARGEVIGKGRNMVTSTNDPTAHAEIVAIRDACANTGSFHLPETVLYASCEPCPMCLAAIYWANIPTVYYCADSNDAARIGFDDRFIYEQLRLPADQRTLVMKQIALPMAEDLFNEWSEKQDRTPY